MSCKKCDRIPDVLALLQELRSELKDLRSELKDLRSDMRVVKTKCSRIDIIERKILGIRSEAEENPTEMEFRSLTREDQHSEARAGQSSSGDFEAGSRRRMRRDEEDEVEDVEEEDMEKEDMEKEEEDVEEEDEEEEEDVEDEEESIGTETEDEDEVSSGDEEEDDRPSSLVAATQPFVPKDIILKTADQDMDLLKMELQAIKNDRTLIRGKSFRKKSTARIAASIATTKRPTALAIVIKNYMDETLYISSKWPYPLYDNVIQLPRARSIAAGQREMLKLSSSGSTRGIIELYTHGRDIRIILLGCRFEGKFGVRALLTKYTAHVSLDQDLYRHLYMQPGYPRGDGHNFAFDRTWTGAEKFAKLGDIRIRSVTEITSSFAIATLDIASVAGLQNISPRKVLAKLRLETSLRSGLQSISNVTEALTVVTGRGNFACVVEIQNFSPVNMKRKQRIFNFFRDRISVTAPLVVKTQTSDCAAAYSSGSFEEDLIYELLGTDLSLGIGFEVRRSGNKFGIGFLSTEAVGGGVCPQEFLKDDPFYSRPHQAHGSAADGTLRVVRRNIVAEAKMTTDRIAVLKVLITTF